MTETLKRTPLYDLHVSLGAKMVPFAGYDMPVQYAPGIIKEHLHTRAAAGLFDISHMGQLWVEYPNIMAELEKIMPGDFQALQPGRIRYSFLLTEQGGVIDDLMVTRPNDPANTSGAYVVINASGRESDVAQIRKQLPHVKLDVLDDRALLALQGPKAAEALARFCDAPTQLKFMQADKFEVKDIGTLYISRSGYSGEDGFEISVPAVTVEKFAKALLENPDVMMIGLGARDSLRLEAGLPLYGHELDLNTSPIEAGLGWAISKRRRAEGGFIGAPVVQKHIAEGVGRKLVGIRPEGRALAREQTEIQSTDGKVIGRVTSGGFGASADAPVCVGYVEISFALPDTPLSLIVRGKPVAAKVVPLPFVPHRYVK